MRFLILALVLLVCAVLVSGALLEDTGFVVIGLHGQVVRTSLVFFVILTVVAVTLGAWLLKLAKGLLHAPRNLHNWSRRRREQKALKDLSAGFLALVQGDWRMAERYLSDGARRAQEPLLHYLGAARAAQAQQAPERQAYYLRMAREQGEAAELPVLLTQMEAALHGERLEEAHALLTRLKEIDNRNDQVMRMEFAYRRATAQWEALLELLPKMIKRNLLSEERSAAIEQEALDGLMSDAAQRREPRAIKSAWERIAKSRRHLPEIVARYARALAASGECDHAQDLVLGGLRRQWDAQLVRLYGELQATDALRQLKIAEGWLEKHGDDPALLLTLGRLSLRNGLWGKARSYLDDLIAKAPSPEAYRLLAEAQEQLGDRDAALRCHRQGLLLATGRSSPSAPLLPPKPA